jgi:deoxycytidine triphosphate deaminase
MQDSQFNGIYSKSEIEDAIESGQIKCTPYSKLNLGEASLDVTLGYYYYQLDNSDERLIFNPFNETAVKDYFDGPYKAVSHEKWCQLSGLKPLEGIPLNHPVIPIKAGERILAHTHEFLGLSNNIAGQISTRSTWAKNGISACLDSSFLNPGDVNRLTLELYNLNQHTIILPVGEPIAQVFFIHSGKDGDKAKSTRTPDIEVVMQTWSPDLILPKAYLNKRNLPVKIEGIPYE